MINKLKEKRIRAMKDRDIVAKGLYDTILGEVQLRESKGEKLNDDKIIKVILKMKESCKLMMSAGDSCASYEIELCDSLLPEMLTHEDIRSIIIENTELMKDILDSPNCMKLMPRVKDVLKETEKVFNGKDVSEVLKEIK
jgi:uncharacterized protein YqeY